MDPLSAYRMAMPGLGMGPKAMPMSPEETISKMIPKDELDKLSSSVLQPRGEMPPSLSSLGGVGGAGGPGAFENMIEEISAKQAEAGAAMRAAMTGSLPLHHAMIAVEEASVSFQLMVEVRNRLLESYQELMRMQV